MSTTPSLPIPAPTPQAPQTWWAIVGWKDQPQPITVVGETAAYVYVARAAHWGTENAKPRREAKDGMCRTWDEARRAMINKAEHALWEAEAAVVKARATLDKRLAIPLDPPAKASHV